jgi:hypothetical protein
MSTFRVQFYANALCTEYIQAKDMREAVRLLQNNYLEGIPFGEYDSLDGYEIQVRSIDLYEDTPTTVEFPRRGKSSEKDYTNYHAPEGAMYVEEIE